MLLEVRNVHVSYGDAPAVWDASLDIDAGQIAAVVGPNGAGKSTLINAIAGILRPRQGRILIDGVDVTSIPGHLVCQHGVAIVPEGRRLFTQMSVLPAPAWVSTWMRNSCRMNHSSRKPISGREPY